MRTLIQRVLSAQIATQEAPNKVVAAIQKGLVILVGFEATDTPVSIEQMGQKIRSLRVFADAKGKMNLAGPEVGAEYLLVSQFTLYADCKYGNRPSFDGAAPKSQAKECYEHFVNTFERMGAPGKVKHGEFGSDLNVELVNDGPCTLWLDSNEVL